jgi:hypothetical protein
MYIDLDTIKRHLIIDHDDDNLLLADLETVAEDAVRRDLNLYSLKDIEDCSGMLPSCVTQAMLLLIGTLYANRESVSYGQAHPVPHAYEYLLDLARNYINKA